MAAFNSNIIPFFCYGETLNCKKYPLKAVKDFWHFILKIFCHLNSLLAFSNLRNKHCQGVSKWEQKFTRAQPDWAYEFPERTGPDTQICRTGPAGPDLYFLT